MFQFTVKFVTDFDIFTSQAGILPTKTTNTWLDLMLSFWKPYFHLKLLHSSFQVRLVQILF